MPGPLSSGPGAGGEFVGDVEDCPLVGVGADWASLLLLGETDGDGDPELPTPTDTVTRGTRLPAR